MPSHPTKKHKDAPQVVVTRHRGGLQMWLLIFCAVLWVGLFLLQLYFVSMHGTEWAPDRTAVLGWLVGAAIIGVQYHLLPGSGPETVLIVSDFGIQSANHHWNGMWVRWRDVACIEAYDPRRGGLRSPAKLVFWDKDGNRASLPLIMPERDNAQRRAFFAALNHYWPGWDRPCSQQPRGRCDAPHDLH